MPPVLAPSPQQFSLPRDSPQGGRDKVVTTPQFKVFLVNSFFQPYLSLLYFSFYFFKHCLST